MKFDILTIFPEMFPCYFGTSMMKKAQDEGLVEINVHSLREWTKDKHRMVDDVAYGGISGMVMKVEPIFYAVDSLKKEAEKKGEKTRVILMSAAGKVMDQEKVRELYNNNDRIMLIAGHYKGVDGRVVEHIADEELSVGEYVITGGEVPAMLVVDAVSRMVPGVIGSPESKEGESFSPGVLHEHEVYTRPEVFAPEDGVEWRVPEVLVSGNHKKIDDWRKEKRKYED